jgi:hypothetical protein
VVNFKHRPLYPLYSLGGPYNRSGKRGEKKNFASTGTRTPTPGSFSPYPVAVWAPDRLINERYIAKEAEGSGRGLFESTLPEFPRRDRGIP